MRSGNTLRAASLVVWIASAWSAPAADERALWDLWQTHVRAPDSHADVVAACRSFAARDPGDAFLPVVRGIESWHLFKAGKADAAAAVLAPWLPARGDDIAVGASRLARAWTTRLDREQVVDALQVYYRKEVRYPDRIEALFTYPDIPAADRLPRTDRWGLPWSYRLTGYPGVPGFQDQRHRLESTTLGATSGLDDALRVPYAGRIRLVPTEVASRRGGELQVVRFEPAEEAGAEGEATAISIGADAGGLYLAYVGRQIVVVCDDLHWKVFRRPGPP